jgi:transposase
MNCCPNSEAYPGRLAGIDISYRSELDGGGTVREGVVDSDPEAISVYVRSKAPDAARIGLETGPTSTWLWTELKRLGLPVICIDARHAKAVLKMQINKSDRNDAIGIARIMQTGWFKEVHVKDIDSHSVRALLASRALLVKIKRDLENHVRVRRDNQDENPATIRMRCAAAGVTKGGRSPTGVTPAAALTPEGPHLAVTAAGKESASPSRGPILWPAGMSPINK